MTLASRTKFLTVRVETPQGGCGPIDSALVFVLPFTLGSTHRLQYFPTRGPTLPLLFFLLFTTPSSLFRSVKAWLLFLNNLCRISHSFVLVLPCLPCSSQPGPSFTMAQSRSRAPLQPSYTFSASLGPDPAQPVLMRHFTAEDLQPASNSMLPAASSQTFSASTSRSLLSRKDSAHIMYPMDPTPADPNAVFLHPPFTNFPNAEKYSQGLTYTVMADNENWFLDPQDFVSPVNNSPNAIPYPAQLEPPRGWCPAKKKDLKERGGEPWPEGQEPRLRCTFCRRTYAGVNAKSMWRRHVYEKHKIAMANRRDTANPDRSRRRAGNSAFYVFQCKV